MGRRHSLHSSGFCGSSCGIALVVASSSVLERSHSCFHGTHNRPRGGDPGLTSMAIWSPKTSLNSNRGPRRRFHRSNREAKNGGSEIFEVPVMTHSAASALSRKQPDSVVQESLHPEGYRQRRCDCRP